MDNRYAEEYEEVSVVGFEAPKSPEASYNSAFPGHDDEARDPPLVPPHLQHTLLSFPASKDASGSIPAPQNGRRGHPWLLNTVPGA